MKKAEIVKDFAERIRKDPTMAEQGEEGVGANPWQPYQGPAGGQGWLNAVTGEVRYQEERPAPEEGAQEAPDAPQIPDEELGEPEPIIPEAEDLPEYLEEGMEVTWETPEGDLVTSEVLDISEGGNVLVEDEDGESFLASPHDIQEHPVELEPPDGWADGWEGSPEHFLDLEHGQTVELYDMEAGEYIEGEVQMQEEDDPAFEGDYISFNTEEHGTIEIAPGLDVGEQYVITAQEDLDFNPDVPDGFEAVEIEDLEHMDEGDVLYAEAEPDLFPDEAFEVEVTEDGHLRTLEEFEGQQRQLTLDGTHNDAIEGLWADPPELFEPLEITGFEEKPYLIDGQYAEMDHPVFGEVDGAIEVHTDSQGNDWFVIEEVPEFEEGDWIEFEDFYGDIREAEVSQIQEDQIVVDRDPEDPTTGLDTIQEEDMVADEISLSSDPDHPLYVGDYLTGVEEPWEPTEEPGDFGTVLPGDEVVIGGSAYTVLDRMDDGLEIEDDIGGQFIPINELDQIEAKVEQDTPEPPADFDEWDDMPEELNPEDTLMYYDSDLGEIVEGTVVEHGHVDDGEFYVDGPDGSEYILSEDVYGHADTGEPVLPNGDDLHYAQSGEYAEVAYRDYHTGKIETRTGFIAGKDPYDGSLKLVDPDTGHISRIEHPDDAVITDYPDPPEVSERWQDASSEEIAESISSDVDIGGHVDRSYLRASLNQHHNPGAVHELMEALVDGGGKCWKNDSGTTLAARWETALSRAVGGIAGYKQPGASPSSEAVRVAETIHELSKERWARNPPAVVHRGLSHPGAAGLFANFIHNPFDKEEYDVPTRAVANWTEQAKTAEDLGDSPVVVYREGVNYDPEDVAAYHDDFFQGPNDSEAEISIRGDRARVSRDKIYFFNDKDVNFGDQPHDWDSRQAEAFKEKAREYGDSVLYDHNPKDEPSINQLENLARIERVLNEKHDESTVGIELFETAKEELEERGVSPEGVEYPELAAQGFGSQAEALPGVVEGPDDFSAGMEVNFIDGTEEMAGEVVDVHDSGQVEILNVDTGRSANFDPEKITEVVYSPEKYGPPSEVDMSGVQPTDFEPLDEFYIWSGGDWKEATVTDVSEDNIKLSGPMGQTEIYGSTELEENFAVPVSEVEALSDEDHYADTDFDYIDAPNVNPDMINVGDEIEVRDSFVNDEFTVPVSSIKDGEVHVDMSQTDAVTYDGDTNLTESNDWEVLDVEDTGLSNENWSEEDLEPGVEVTTEIDDSQYNGTITEMEGDDIWIDSPAFSGDAPFKVDEVVAADVPDDPDEEFSEEVDDILEDIETETQAPYADDTDDTDDAEDDFPTLADTSLLTSSPEYHEVHEDDYVVVDGQVYEVNSKPEKPTGYFQLEGPAGPMDVQEWQIDELVEVGGEADGSDGTGQDLSDYGLMENESITIEGDYGVDYGYVEYVDDEGNFVVQTPDLDDDTITVEPEDVPEAEGSDPPDDDGPITPDDVGDMNFSMGESFEFEFPGGPSEVEVVDTSVDPAYPPTVEDEHGDRWLLWEDGEIEPV